jgi:hypothetical protein
LRRTIQAASRGIPEGSAVTVHPLDHQAETEQRIGKKPSGIPVASGTVTAADEVTLDVRTLAQGNYLLHATVGKEERFVVFAQR